MSVPIDPRSIFGADIPKLAPPQGQVIVNPLPIWKEGDPIPDISRPFNNQPPIIGPNP